MTTIFAVIVMSRSRSDAAVLIGIMPVASFATGVLVAVSLFRFLALPRGATARGVTIGALLAIGLAVLLDAASVLFAAKALVEQYRYRGARDFVDIVAAGWPLVALVASLEDERLVARAGWVQAFAIASGSAQIAVVFAVASGSGRTSAQSGLLVVLGLVVVALGATITAVVLHALLVGEARAAVLTPQATFTRVDDSLARRSPLAP